MVLRMDAPRTLLSRLIGGTKILESWGQHQLISSERAEISMPSEKTTALPPSNYIDKPALIQP